MRHIHYTKLFSPILITLLLAGCGKEKIRIVHEADSPAQQEMAAEMANYLERTYPEFGFEPAETAAKGSRNIVLRADPSLDPSNKETYRIQGSPDLLQVTGSSDKGIIHGAYALLKAMGWQARTGLAEGLAETYRWYLEQLPESTAR